MIQTLFFSVQKKTSFFSTALFLLALLFVLILHTRDAYAGYTTCYASTTSPSSIYIGNTTVSLASTTNSMYDSNNSGPTIYCTKPGASGYNFGTSIVASSTGCGANSVPLFALSSSSGGVAYNSHVEDPSIGRYGFLLCLNYTSSAYDVVKIATQANNCDGYGTTLFSAPSYFTTTGNAHFGDANAYTMKRCLTLNYAEGLTVSYSSNTVGFGSFSPVATRYATSDGLGTTTAPTATSSSFYVDVNAIGNTRYAISLQGSTLTNQNATSYTIPAIGGTPTSLTPGVEQFGIQATTTCVTPSSFDCTAGLVASSSIAFPYNTAGYAYEGTATTSTLVGNGPSYDGSSAYGGSRFYFKLAANIAPLTPAGNYVTDLTVIVTSEF